MLQLLLCLVYRTAPALLSEISNSLNFLLLPNTPPSSGARSCLYLKHSTTLHLPPFTPAKQKLLL